jgi:hypothetical protein
MSVQTQVQVHNIDALVEDWFCQKSVLEAERAHLLAIESKILDALAQQGTALPEKGQKSFKHGTYKMTIKTDINFKLKDKEVYQGLMSAGEVPNVFEPTLSQSKVNNLVKAGVFGMYSKHFDSAPAKPAFTVVATSI